jgi:hypothetical protein
MYKFSSFDVKTALITGSNIIKEAQAEIDVLTAKVAFYEKEKRAVKLAEIMEDKGLNSSMNFDEKVDALMEHPNLDSVEEAINMQPNFLGKVASLDDQNTTESYLRMIQ